MANITDEYNAILTDFANNAVDECRERKKRGEDDNLWDCVRDEIDTRFIYTNDRAIVVAYYFIETGEAKKATQYDQMTYDFISEAYEKLVEDVYEYARETIDLAEGED